MRDVATDSHRNVPSPEPSPGTAGLVRVSAGDSFTCGVAEDGHALCWGVNVAGELGNGEIGPPARTPTPVHGSLTFTDVSTIGAPRYGYPHACGLTVAGTAYCWGSNVNGQLGNGGTTSSATPVAVSGGHLFESLSVGTRFTCGIVRGGAAYCWGQATDGQLGVDPRYVAENCGGSGGAILPCSTTPAPVPGGHKFTTISAGSGYVCGLDTGGVAYCWGANLDGQLGNGTRLWSFAPGPVLSSLRFTAITAGTTFACALTPNAEAFCWGSNSLGQLGDGTTVSHATPTKVMTDLRFAAIDVGDDEACALTREGAAYCWGSDLYEKLGNGS
jgi:alpha-tubulin suppressor-like RCC1 family protein